MYISIVFLQLCNMRVTQIGVMYGEGDFSAPITYKLNFT